MWYVEFLLWNLHPSCCTLLPLLDMRPSMAGDSLTLWENPFKRLFCYKAVQWKCGSPATVQHDSMGFIISISPGKSELNVLPNAKAQGHNRAKSFGKCWHLGTSGAIQSQQLEQYRGFSQHRAPWEVTSPKTAVVCHWALACQGEEPNGRGVERNDMLKVNS